MSSVQVRSPDGYEYRFDGSGPGEHSAPECYAHFPVLIRRSSEGIQNRRFNCYRLNDAGNENSTKVSVSRFAHSVIVIAKRACFVDLVVMTQVLCHYWPFDGDRIGCIGPRMWIIGAHNQAIDITFVPFASKSHNFGNAFLGFCSATAQGNAISIQMPMILTGYNAQETVSSWSTPRWKFKF